VSLVGGDPGVPVSHTSGERMAAIVFFPFSLFGDFQSLPLDFPWRSFGSVSLRDSRWMSHMRTLCLFAWSSWEGVLEG
jgi:hypothetical protein